MPQVFEREARVSDLEAQAAQLAAAQEAHTAAAAQLAARAEAVASAAAAAQHAAEVHLALPLGFPSTHPQLIHAVLPTRCCPDLRLALMVCCLICEDAVGPTGTLCSGPCRRRQQSALSCNGGSGC